MSSIDNYKYKIDYDKLTIAMIVGGILQELFVIKWKKIVAFLPLTFNITVPLFSCSVVEIKIAIGNLGSSHTSSSELLYPLVSLVVMASRYHDSWANISFFRGAKSDQRADVYDNHPCAPTFLLKDCSALPEEFFGSYIFSIF